MLVLSVSACAGGLKAPVNRAQTAKHTCIFRQTRWSEPLYKHLQVTAHLPQRAAHLYTVIIGLMQLMFVCEVQEALGLAMGAGKRDAPETRRNASGRLMPRSARALSTQR